MPDSIRALLQGIAEGEAGPSQDLAAGARRRARRIGQRRFAAGAIAAVCGLALAGLATAEMFGGVEAAPPAGDPAASQGTPVAERTETEDAQEESCGSSDGWTGWTGWDAPDAAPSLGALPEVLYFEVYRQEEEQLLSSIHRFEDEAHTTVLPPAPDYALAPNGERYTVAYGEACDGALVSFNEAGTLELGIGGKDCPPSWSPDSNRVALNMPDGEGGDGYLLDVSTGEMSELSGKFSCSPRWTPDGEYLVSGDGVYAARPDGSGEVVLDGAASWTGDPGFTGLSSISADLTRACFHFELGDTAQSGRVEADRCDRYVDLTTGEELELPVETERAQVVFLADGSMIVVDHRYNAAEHAHTILVSLFDPKGDVVEERSLESPDGSEGTFLRGYRTG
ncbi:hypothetical protein LO763_15035 [Glycomyces sp. A-F 0318]|uniref:TolB family protein n=1 Tax=Glycomyces amatae TaxID=2881355 RepID=UPI001E363AD4|nr:hypothetical protein [Glycomyces amatae]MCD0444931.1 hypothetical protein [Glycomyces amatae]